MIKSDKKYVDPTEVLNSVVDDMGNKISVGDQRDITEYHLNFLSRIEEAFYYQEKCLKVDKCLNSCNKQNIGTKRDSIEFTSSNRRSPSEFYDADLDERIIAT